MDYLNKDKSRRDKWNPRKDSKQKAKRSKTHEPKVDYDRHDRSWIKEQLDEFPNE